MKFCTIIFIPNQRNRPTTLKVPNFIFRLSSFLALVIAGLSGFVIMDYIHLQDVKDKYQRVTRENNGLKSEVQILVTDLNDVRKSLDRIKDYTTKLNDLVSIKVNSLQDRTGIGPLSSEEMKAHRASMAESSQPSNHMPIGVNIENLNFKAAFSAVTSVKRQSNKQAIELQHLLGALSKKQSILKSIPTFMPVDGWITSNFGIRTSPFTGSRSMHRGIDIAASVGTPVLAPADGVVIFSGRKAGFGNFIMIAHYSSGIVTRYGHNAQNMVQAGQTVSRGEQIATVGKTGRTTGPHLHYEVQMNGKTVNPRKFIFNEPYI